MYSLDEMASYTTHLFQVVIFCFSSGVDSCWGPSNWCELFEQLYYIVWYLYSLSVTYQMLKNIQKGGKINSMEYI